MRTLRFLDDPPSLGRGLPTRRSQDHARSGRLRPGSVALSLVALTLGLVGCARHPAELRIKGPSDALGAVATGTGFPVFKKKGETLQLRVSAFGADGTYLGAADVDWDVSDRSVATVNQSGLVTVLSSGDFNVIARTKAAPNLEAQAPMKAVIEDAVRIVVPNDPPDGATLELSLGEVVSLQAVVVDDRGHAIDGAKIFWNSSSYAATITPQGELEGRAIGTTQVVAESVSGKTARLDVNVGDWKTSARPKGRRSSSRG